MNTSLNDFFENATIFITGGTGFIGKVLIEKLLRSQTNISKLYLLIRSKKGKCNEERAQETIFKQPIFKQLIEAQPDFIKKIGIIPGDILKPELALSENDKKLIFNEVNIVFNCAASTNMKAPLKDNIRCNVASVIELLNLCRRMKNLKSLVIVSTAYSNCSHSVIEEKFYKSPISPELAFKLCDELDDATLEKITPLILGGHPNTYTFSKSLMENTLLLYNDLPIVLYRPAIVVASYREPFPGWIDNLNGPTGYAYITGMGVLRTILMDRHVKQNWVPIDMCTNAIIVSSWHGIQTRLLNSNKIPIYNYAFDKKNWTSGRCIDFMINSNIKLNQSIWKPGTVFVSTPFQYAITKFFLHTIPIFVLDALLVLYGSKFRLSKVFEKMIYPQQEAFKFFATKQWTMKEDNTLAMWKSLTESEQKRYSFDSESVNMEEFLNAFCLGIKVFIAKESMEDNHIAVRRHKILAVIHYITVFIVFGSFLWIFFRVLKCFQL